MPYSVIVTPVVIFIQLTYFTIIKVNESKTKDMTSRYYCDWIHVSVDAVQIVSLKGDVH